MVNLLSKNNDEIDFEEIELKIQGNIKKRKNIHKEYNLDIDNAQPNIYSLGHLKEHLDIKIPRKITSHRPIVGPGLVKAREILDEEIRRSLDPVIDKQIDFNKKLIDYLYVRLQKIVDENQGRIERLERQNSEFGGRIERLERQMKESIDQTNFNIKKIFKLSRG